MKVKRLPKKKKLEIINELSNLLKGKGEVLFSYLHGSFIENSYFRDIDIAIFLKENQISKNDILEYELVLSSELQSEIKYPVEVRAINYAPLAFQYYSTTGKLLSRSDDDKRVDFLTYIRSLYLDYKPISQKILQEMLSG